MHPLPQALPLKKLANSGGVAGDKTLVKMPHPKVHPENNTAKTFNMLHAQYA